MTQASPPAELLAAMQRLRHADNAGALDLAEAGMVNAADRFPYLALASLAALRAGSPDRAIPHLRELVAAKPDDTASRINLANALVETGDLDAALALADAEEDAAFARIAGYVHQQRGEYGAAAARYRDAVAREPNDLASWNNLGNVLSALGEHDEAIAAFERAISIAPGQLDIYLNLAELLGQAERNEARLKVMKDAWTLAPRDYRVLVDLGLAHAAEDDLDAAISVLREAIAVDPARTQAKIELGMILEGLNRIEELSDLAASVDMAKAGPEASFLQAWVARREGRFEDAAMHADAIPETVHPVRRYHLVGGIADRLGDAEAAFAAFERMNAMARSNAPAIPGPTYRERVEADQARWRDDWADRWTDHVSQDGRRDPVFLVGFPRSGTTLLDTILMALPELSVLEERPMVARTRRSLDDGEDLAGLAPERIDALRDRYFEEALRFGWQEDRWLVDKHPLNMERLPFIHRLFPNAKVILAERHPYDVVLSCFMANFEPNLAMRSFTDLTEAARTYDAVLGAWERANALLPIDRFAIRYERLVADAEAELRPLVAWLDLEWREALLDHTATARERGRVRTASYSQIGEKLYTRARFRWRRYAGLLAPVVPILRPWAERMDYET